MFAALEFFDISLSSRSATYQPHRQGHTSLKAWEIDKLPNDKDANTHARVAGVASHKEM
jgi:hypothetical protein